MRDPEEDRPDVIVGCFVVGMILTPPGYLLPDPAGRAHVDAVRGRPALRQPDPQAPSLRRTSEQPRRPAACTPVVNLLLLEDADFVVAAIVAVLGPPAAAPA